MVRLIVMMLSNQIIRDMKAVAPKVGLALVALVVAFAVWRMWFRKEKYSQFQARQWNWTANKYKCASGWKDTGKDKPDDSKGPYLGTSWQGDRSSRHCKQVESSRFSDLIWDEDKFVCPPGFRETGETGERACAKKDYEDVDAGCSKDFPARGKRWETEGKCCKAKYSRICKGETTAESVAKSGCPSEFPVKGKKDSNRGKCCKGAYSNKCEGAAPAWSDMDVHAKYPYWGWKGTPNEGLRCRNKDNTGCETKWEGGKLKDTKRTGEDVIKYVKKQKAAALISAYPYWGWKGTKNEGLRCKNKDNTGCDTKWEGGTLKDKAPAPAPTPAVSTDVVRVYPYWGWKGTKNEGLRCKFNNNTGCTTKWVGGKLVEA